MELFSRVFPLDWTTVEYVSAVVGVLVVVLCLLAFLLRRSRRQRDQQNRTIAEQIAVATAGEMMARSQENGDRFSLKEGNSIATLITDAVLALNSEDTRQARRAVRRLKAGNSAPATEIFAELARAKAGRGRARRAAGRCGVAPSGRADFAQGPAPGA